MRVLITGLCGFVGSVLARELLAGGDAKIVGLDNLSRPGSEANVEPLRALGAEVHIGDVRDAGTVAATGNVDWIIDASANASVLAGLEGDGASRELVETNLYTTLNLLEHARKHGAGFILLSTSRVYAMAPLMGLAYETVEDALVPCASQSWPKGLSAAGVSEAFSTAAPISLYGATKLASEVMALEYGASFGFPVWINRCGVLAGAGQFGRPDQGLFAFWLNAWRAKRALRYTGFGGTGAQVRDCLHPRDLVPVLRQQMAEQGADKPRIANFAGGVGQSMSLAQLSAWCEQRFGPRPVLAEPEERRNDIPWMVLDCARAADAWNWQPQTPLPAILEEIATHAEANPEWLTLCGLRNSSS